MKSLAGMPGTTGAFPNVISGDDTAPGAHDGTPLLDQWVRDLFGGFQALINGASITPSGSAETCGAAAGNLTGSQLAEAIQLICGYPGEIFAFPAPLATLDLPAGMRALKLEGQTIVLADYPRLTTAVYCGDAANPTAGAFYKTSDTPGTIRNIAGAYMVLPDMRGQFIRGLDLAGAVDPDGASRVAGDIQANSVQPHDHDGILTSEGAYTGIGSDVLTGATKVATRSSGGDVISTVTTGTDIGTETRPTNVALTWCIRF